MAVAVPATDAQPAQSYLRIGSLVVAHGVRGRGVGTALMEHAEAWGRAQGLTAVALNVYEFNAAARRLYEHLGYATLSRKMGKPLV